MSGKCRADQSRMDVTGARLGLTGAEAILKLRAIRGNGDWTNYWHYHLTQERRRVHESRYLVSSHDSGGMFISLQIQRNRTR